MSMGNNAKVKPEGWYDEDGNIHLDGITFEPLGNGVYVPVLSRKAIQQISRQSQMLPPKGEER